jgi:hypothetical protein
LGRERGAKHVDRPLPSGGADHVATRAQPFAQLAKGLLNVPLASVNAGQAK